MIDPETGQEMSISRPSKLGIALRRYWPAIALTAVVLAAIGFVASSFMSKSYAATGEVFITEAGDSNNTPSDIETQARLISSHAVLSQVGRMLGESTHKLSSHLAVSPVTGANVVELTGHAGSAAGAVALVEATFRGYQSVSAQLPASQQRESYLSSPALPHAPSAPHPSRNAAIGLVLGIVLALGLAWLQEIRRPTAADLQLVVERLGVPMFADLTASRLERHVRRARAKAFTALSLDLDELAPTGTTMLCLAAVRRGDLAWDLPSGLAAAFAGGGWRVIVVDGDSDGALTREFGAVGKIGLSDLVGGTGDVASAPVAMDTPGMRLLPHGRRGLNRSQPNLAAELQRVLGQLTEQADLVLVVVPSVGQDTEARLLAAATHGVILFIQATTPIAAIESARERLSLFRATILGFVRDDARVRPLRLPSRLRARSRRVVDAMTSPDITTATGPMLPKRASSPQAAPSSTAAPSSAAPSDASSGAQPTADAASGSAGVRPVVEAKPGGGPPAP